MVVRYLNLEFRLEIIDIYNISLYIYLYIICILYINIWEFPLY